MVHVRTVKTASNARAVQIVWSNKKGVRKIEHLGSAHSDAEVALLKAAGRQKIHAGQGELDLGLDPDPDATGGVALPITSSSMGVLLDALTSAYGALKFPAATKADETFRQLVFARIIEPTSKIDSLRVLAEAGIEPVSYPTLNRHLAKFADPKWRENLAKACAAHINLSAATYVLFDVTTLHFEIHEGDGFRESGYSKERRLEPQLTIGLLTDASGFPLMVNAFEGNKAETHTMLPTIKSFMAAHRLKDVVIVADAGMISTANMRAIEAEGLSFILGMKLTAEPYPVTKWRTDHPGEDLPDGQVFIQPWPASPSDKRRDQVRYYRYSSDRAKRTSHGIDEQVRKAQSIINGKAALGRNKYVKVDGAKKTVNRELEAKRRALAGVKGYVTNIENPNPELVIDAYHQLFQIEKSFRMAKSDLRARPVFHHERDSIEAHLTIVFAAIAVGRWLENVTGWSIKKLVKTLRRYRTVHISASGHDVKAVDPIPADAATVIAAINDAVREH